MEAGGIDSWIRMLPHRHTALLRSTALAGLAVSAVLTADTVRPGRAFCPLEQACEQASASPLGSILGVSTAILGAAAFGAFLLLSLLPPEWARRILRPAGLVALGGGAAFIAYQVFALDALCPLCLGADGAAVALGATALFWPRLPVRYSGRPLPGDPDSVRAAWTLAALLVVVTPFAVQQPEEASWEEITPLEALADLPAADAPAGTAATPIPSTSPAPVPVAPTLAAADLEPTPNDPGATGDPAADVVALPPAGVPLWITPFDGAAVVAAQAEPDGHLADGPAQPLPAPALPATPPASPRAQGPLVVEYVNAFCRHCRATHQRLERVLTKTEVPVRRRRVYTWGGNGVPLWARACVYASVQGLEEALFRELLQARDDTPREVYAAAARAGVDVAALRQALRDPTPPARLQRDHRLVRTARLRKLPTLDIGRRRLMGEQSEAELRTAVLAAIRGAPDMP